MKLRLKDDTPFRSAPYRIPLHKRREVEEQIEELTSKGIIRPSHSPWASPITLVPKKDGGTRMCVDYRQLNSQTLMDTYPLPRIQDILDQLSGSTIYSLIDLQSAYHQIPMDEASIPLTAFVTHKGLYEYTRMPFGLKTAPAIFQRCMNDVLRPLHGTCVLPYLDDICVFSSDATAHENDVRAVLKLLSDAGFTAKASKCHFNMDEMDLLGFTINKDGTKPQEKKVSAISGMVAPRDVKSLRRFLGMVGFHRAMIPDYSKHSSILTDLTRKKVRWQWDESHQEAFEYLRDILTWDGVVQYYPDLNKPLSLCDEYGRKRIVNRSQVRLAPADGWSDIGRRLRRAERRRIQNQHRDTLSQPVLTGGGDAERYVTPTNEDALDNDPAQSPAPPVNNGYGRRAAQGLQACPGSYHPCRLTRRTGR